MILYFLRHGIAAEKPEWKGSDSDRPLTKEGIRKMKKAAKGMRGLGLDVNWILTSPYRRAYHTAQIVAKELKAVKNLRVAKTLAPDGDPKALLRRLALDFRSWETVLLVGHDPYLSRMVGVLTGSPELLIDFRKGGLCMLISDSLTWGACATLEWLLSPKILKRLA